jgi:hypothetical protein
MLRFGSLNLIAIWEFYTNQSRKKDRSSYRIFDTNLASILCAFIQQIIAKLAFTSHDMEDVYLVLV